MEVFLAFRHTAALSDERLFDPARNFGVNGEDRIIVARVRLADSGRRAGG